MTDTIQQILKWHRAACPEPNKKSIAVQIGCHYEEVAEMADALADYDLEYMLDTSSIYYKGDYNMVPKDINKLKPAILDSLCDQIVTALGVGYRMGFDMAGALAEVARSNDSKMVNGRFEYDENGKVMKPDGYSPPNLDPFLVEKP